MTFRTFLPSRSLAALIALGVCNHVVLSGTRISVSLDALARGASPAVVGVLMALFAVLPMFLGISAGRLADRIGVRKPMLWGSIGCAVGAALPALVPGLPALFASASLVGVAFMLFQVPVQQATGEMGPPSERAANFSFLALGYALSGFFGPLIAGFAIDSLGYRFAFALIAAIPLIPTIVLVMDRLSLPILKAHPPDKPHAPMLELLAHPPLRRLFIINALFAMGWDLHTIFVPIYGSRVGLPAAQIGMVLAAFAAATFVVRLAIPVITRHVQEVNLLTVALVIAGLVYVVFPFLTSAAMLGVLSFVLGLALGSGQPIVLSLLHTHAPPGRVGETVGMRMSLMNTMAVLVPLVFGALGGSIGLLPVFWSVGLFLGTGGYYMQRKR
ncbi:MAG TPA: MFS transporter [Casimicrobiaceae bacterium]|nr:MFS transporter [Casimicrobiaceae bacterium]